MSEVNQEKKTAYDLIIIGGGPAGMTAAIFSRMMYPKKSIAVIKDIEEGVVPCGTPYMFHTMKHPKDNKMACGRAADLDIHLMHGSVSEIRRKQKTILTSCGEYSYGKLILCLGSNPIIPPMEGVHTHGVYAIKKDYAYLEKLYEQIKKAKQIVIVGGGFIGIEFADELSSIKGKKVTVVEMMPRILSTFDPEFSELAHTALVKKGVTVLTQQKVAAIKGEKTVTGVALADGVTLKADMVLLGIGALPNTQLAIDSGLKISPKRKAIRVNQYMQTSDSHIYAAGDCAMKTDFFTGKESPVMLASNAATEAKILSSNLYMPLPFKSGGSKGTLAIYGTDVCGTYFAGAGLTEEQAKQRGLKYVVGNASSFDKHPETMPGTHTVKMKLIFAKRSRRLIGGQVSGGQSVGELANMLGLAIQNKLTLFDLRSMQVGSHPHLTAAPTMYPVVLAAYDAMAVLYGMKKPEGM